ncbi:MAG TPA: sigma-70 family RNA polymerase sigma factor [Nocardioides sp.]|uniref:RNA polymerase sigma factor n=1 Tax=Nocardioides sp. TaxID=35761 RepID=UPI002ED94027
MGPSDFEEFFRAAYPQLVRYAQRRFPPELAEELASTTLLTIWTKNVAAPRDDVEWRTLHAFAFRILDGHMRNAARAESARSEAVTRAQVQSPGTPAGADPAEEVVSAQWPDWAKPLSLTDADVLGLVVDGYKVSEIALILGCAPAAVSMRLRRARKKALLLWRREVDRGRRQGTR